MKKVTIQDVAKELNLSRNTVAKALNNSDTVAYETRYVVIKKAYEMGYSKLSPVVLSEFKIKDRMDKVKTIVVLARRELSTFWNRIIMGISDELNKNNCKLQFNFISEEDEHEHALPLDILSDVSGIIMLSVFSKDYIDIIMRKDIPVVFLDAPCDTEIASKYGDVVIFEGLNSVKRITKHLIDQKMERIAFIGDISYCRTILERYNGYRTALRESSIDPDQELLIVKHVPNRYYRRDEIEHALDKLTSMPEAIVCANDDIARDVILTLKSKGYNIPKDVAVTGFDNKEETSFIDPSLTTVQIANQRMGRKLVQQLMWRIENLDMPHEVLFITTEVLIRESSRKVK